MARYRQFGQHCLSLGRREQTEANAVQAPGYASVQSHAPPFEFIWHRYLSGLGLA